MHNSKNKKKKSKKNSLFAKEKSIDIKTDKHQKLYEDYKRSNEVSENAMEWIWEIDSNGKYIYSNKVVKKILGYKQLEIYGKKFYDYFHPDDKDDLKEAAFEIFKRKKPFREFISRNIRKDGRIIWLSTSGLPMIDKKGGLAGYRGAITEVTELITLQKELMNASEELEKRVAQRTASLERLNNEMYEEIQERKKLESQLLHAQKMEAVGELAGGLAHDFNNILTTIIGYSYILLRKTKKNEEKKNIEHILISARKASNVIRSLLTFSRKQKMLSEKVFLNDIIKGIKKLLTGVISDNIELRIDLAKDQTGILADVGQVEQVIMNLITNACHAMPDGGSITIKTELVKIDEAFVKFHRSGKPGKYILLSVSDNGIGMEKDIKDKIFEPFFTTKAVGEGTGLGLSMVFGIIQSHNGFINVYSEIGNGTIFNIYFPAEKTKIDSTVIPELSEIKGGNETILLAEDEPSVSHVIKNILKEYGYKVKVTKNGEDAFKKILNSKNKIDLVISDVIMPKKNGIELYNMIKNKYPELEIILISGYSKDIIKKKGFEEDKSNFIHKPVIPKDLLGKVRELLDLKKKKCLH